MRAKIIKSVSDNQSEIIKDILRLYVPSGHIDCDPTYSCGNFYNNTGIARPTYCFDIAPQNDEVEYADCRHLPLPDASIECMMFDPPFLATTGKSLSVNNSSNIINKRFGVYSSEQELHGMYVDALTEAYRVLKKNGVLIFKCQDKVSSGKQYMSHLFIANQAIDAGFYPQDLFILVAKNRLYADWQVKNQKHARKYHCYFWVFEKTPKKIQYITQN